MSKIRFAIIGTGSIAITHAQAILGAQEAVLVAVYGRSAVKAQEFAAKYHCDWYDDLEKLLKRADIDAVAICTPSGTHAEIGIAAAMAGKHVLVEKPIDVNLEQADALIVACQEQGVKLGAIFQRRYSEGMLAVKDLLAKGQLGKLVFGGCYIKLYRSQDYYDSGAWRGTWDYDGGGVLMNQGIHYIDMLQAIMGPVTEVTAQCASLGHAGIEVEDTAVATVKFQSGALGVIEGTTCAYPGLFSRIDLYGTEGTAIIENDILMSVQLKNGYCFTKDSSTKGAGVSSPNITCTFHQQQFEEMIKAIKTGTNQFITGVEARKSLEVVLAIYQAAFTQSKVSLPLSDSSFVIELAKAGGFK